VKRVVILGPGGAGKSTLARHLSALMGLPVIELDQHFWTEDLRPLSKEQWRSVQKELVQTPDWIMDGDLGPYDVLEPRLTLADTVVVLDFSRWRCVLRSLRRSCERLDFWRWLWTWRRTSRPQLLAAIATFAENAVVEIITSPRALEDWLATLSPL
jgi:adenylate kinase family enzyme